MSKTLDGEHLCLKHQGNHSHYAEHNCTICKQDIRITELERKLAEQQTIVANFFKMYGKDVSEAGLEELNNLLTKAKEDSVPEGWQVVPMNPTKEQYDAGSNVGYGIGGSPPSPSWVYEAMLAAAPKP